MFKNKILVASLFMLCFNLIGSFLLFLEPLREFVLALTPINLIAILIFFLWANSDYSIKFFKTLLLIYVIGIFIEVLGVNLKIIFGEYFYGKTLGYKLLGTPLVIGVNWLTLSLASYGISRYIFRQKVLIVLFASGIMILTDYLIEPLAASLDFWYWANNEIPFQNYVAWFFVSLIIQAILVKTNFKLNIKLCLALLISQILFFVIQYFNYGLF